MIKRLLLENFVKHEHREIIFEKGLTAISGKNGGGKSLIQEAIRFALFGTAALRGKVTDYDKRLKVTMTCQIGDKEYEIIRTLKDCSFNGVVGTTACNKAIEDVLGFGMNVFDMGCCAKQSEITRLGDMKPTERKQAVDKLIGLDTLELLRKEVKQTISELRGRKEGLERYMTEPVEPTKPLGYVPSSQLETELRTALDNKARHDALIETFMACPQIAPVEPIFDMEKPAGDPTTKHLKNLLAETTARLLALGADQPCLEDTGLLEGELEHTLAWEKFLDLEQPTMIEEECTRIEEEWLEYNSWLRSEKVTCPKCGETFALSGVSEKEKPSVDLAEVKRQKELITQWRLRPTCPKPTGELRPEQLRSKIDAVREKRKNHEAYLEVIADLAKIEPCDYDAWDRYNEAEKNYRILKNKYDLELRAYQQGRELLGKIAELSEKIKGVDIEQLQEMHRKFLQYETEHATYLTLKKRYDELVVEHNELEKELECYTKADEGLVELKSKIKLYVIPSLQKVATELVTEMTEGELNEMKITEDFEVTLNGKELNLLSGSEKAVANLALRLGLGCVLTHKIFNVFLGDEIDESMSDERATLVSDSLHKLLGQINQIILISHKDIVADHYICVDNKE